MDATSIHGALSSHEHWLVDLTAAVQDWTMSTTLPSAEEDHTTCALGQWLLNEGRSLICDAERFTRIHDLHVRVHAHARAMKDELQRGGRNQASASLFYELHRCSRQMTSLLVLEQTKYAM